MIVLESFLGYMCLMTSLRFALMENALMETLQAVELQDFDYHYSLVVGDLDCHFNSEGGVHFKPAEAATDCSDQYLG